jgi:Sec-independent protein translocase protein TatA
VRRRSWLAAIVAVAIAVAGCGSSPEDKARDDGKAVGKAVREVKDATSVDQATQALNDVKAAVDEVHTDTRDHIKDQVSTLRGQISGSIDTAKAAGNPADATASLQTSAQNVRAQADAFRNGNNSIANEFWRGFEEGYDGD